MRTDNGYGVTYNMDTEEVEVIKSSTWDEPTYTYFTKQDLRDMLELFEKQEEKGSE